MRILLMLLLSLSLETFAQPHAVEYLKTVKKESDKYETLHFKLKNISLDEVKKQCANYTMYFELVRSETLRDGIIIELRMINHSDMNRKVVHRLMVSLQVKEIEFSGKKYETSDFFKKFIY